jgi:hypothetical protein
MHSTDCTPCQGSMACLGGTTARVTVEILNLNAGLVNEMQLTKLRTAYAQDIAGTLGVENGTVVDLFGHAGSTTVAAARPTGAAATEISAFVTVPDGSSTNALAEQLYTTSFRSRIVSTTQEVLAQSSSQVAVVGNLSAPAVSIKPERFVPKQPTTTVMTSTTTVASTTVITTTVKVHHDLSTSSEAFLASSTAAVSSAGMMESLATRQIAGYSRWLLAGVCVFAGVVS